MSGTALAARERLSSVNKALEAARIEQQEAHQAYETMEGDESDAAFVTAYNEAVDAAKAKDAEVDNLVKMASNLAGGLAHAKPLQHSGGSPVEILSAHPGMEGFRRHTQSLVAAEVIGRDDAVRRLSLGLPMFAAGATAESLTAVDQRLYPPVQIPVRQPGLLDLIQIGATDSDTVKYGKQTVRTSAAASVARGSGASFSEATYTWSTASVTVETIGHYVKAPIETLNDQGQLRTLLDGQLSDDLLLKLDDLVYEGAGSGTDMEGITTNSDIATYVQDATNFGIIDSIRKGITKVQQNLFGNPTGLVMSPATWERVELERSTATAKSGNYLVRGADASIASAAPYSLFGLPVVVSALVTDDEVLIGNFRRGFTLWLRQGVTVEMTNSNEADFLANMVAIKAQIRAAGVTVQPKAFCLVTLIS